MAINVRGIFIAPKGGVGMTRVEAIDAIAGRGLDRDRYCLRRGHWRDDDECQVTLIEQEALEEIYASTGVNVLDGEHRRNIVTQGIRLEQLEGRKFRIGEAVFEYDRPRPPCGYIASLTTRKMTKALWGRSGIGARVLQAGRISAGDSIAVIDDG